MNRLRTFAALAAVIVAGLSVRSYITNGWPALLTKAAGDALWTTAVFLVLRISFAGSPASRIAIASLLVSAAVEFSQLCHAPWLENLRATWPGGIALGHGFHAADFRWYAAGALLGMVMDRFSRPSQRNHPSV
jgi:hypothetical protein